MKKYGIVLTIGLLTGYFLTNLVSVLPNIQAIRALLANQSSYYQNPVIDYSARLLTWNRDLTESVRVLCWVMTGPQNHYKKAVHIKATWGQHCNKLIFMSSEEDSDLGAVALNVSEGRQNLWGKTKQAFKYVYDNHRQDADWFLKADDDTFVIVENLRNLLKDYDTTEEIHFGHRFKYLGGYFAGGSGYVLSQGALKRFVEKGIDNSTMCKEGNAGDEDVNMGRCMKHLNITVGDSRDSEEKKRFFPFEPKDHLIPRPGKKDWAYFIYTKYPEANGTACCSDTAISFHYIPPHMQYVMYYLIYHLRAVGAEENPLDKVLGEHKP